MTTYRSRTGVAMLASVLMAFSVLGGTIALLGASAATADVQPYRLA